MILMPGRCRYESGIITDAQGKAGRTPRGPAADPGDEVRFGFKGRFFTHRVLVVRAAKLSAFYLSLNLQRRGTVLGVIDEPICPSNSIGKEYASGVKVPKQRVGNM